MRKALSISTISLLITFCITIFAQTLFAGEVGSDLGIDLRASFRYDAPQDHLDTWEAAYKSASRLLYDATDGEFYIKKIKACNDSLGGKQADVFINDGTNTAYVGYPSLGCPNRP